MMLHSPKDCPEATHSVAIVADSQLTRMVERQCTQPSLPRMDSLNLDYAEETVGECTG